MMTTPAPSSLSVGPDTLVTVKVHYNDNARRFKIPLRDLGARVLPQKLRQLLSIPADSNVIFERFSDSAGCYVRLDTENLAVYKQLYRAAKAKSKLRIKATAVSNSPSPSSNQEEKTELPSQAKSSYLDTVLSSPLPKTQADAAPSTVTDLTSDITTTADNAAPVGEPMNWLSTDSPKLPTFHIMNPQWNVTAPDARKSPTAAFFIDCNNCGQSVPSEHYHCSICENGDYDLCPQCVDSGVSCPGDEHWLVKRFVKDGVVTNGTTEKVPPRKVKSQEIEKPAEPVKEEPQDSAPTTKSEERICNACFREFNEADVVACSDCEDYDLCMTCLVKDTHGHDPSHSFSLHHDREFCLKSLVLSRCKPGRHYQHAAICDGCEKRIIGVRHKCLACPDWDYCSDCFGNAANTHPKHRFAPIYDAIAQPPRHHEVHYGIFCDGPLCKNKPCPPYLTGVRYKCAVCFDTDFCANCEALPTNPHNRTHPLVMFKTPIRSVNISMLNEDNNGGHLATSGDRIQKSTSTQAGTPAAGDAKSEVSQNAADANAAEKVEPCPEEQVKAEVPTAGQPSGYDAFFVRDAIADGTVVAPGQVFQQTWTLYNPGPLAWPAGSDVRFVSGDSMFNVDMSRASNIDYLTSAMGSNKLSAPLEPGQSADFTVTLRAPNRVGGAISYWRLKLANGMPFGHRLWCEVQMSEVAKKSDDNPDAKQAEGSGSAMVFPTLDKESPETSTHEAMAPAAPAAPSVSNLSEGDALEDMESLTLGEDGTDAGFVTDEEYDVLDASDQEFQDAKQAQK